MSGSKLYTVTALFVLYKLTGYFEEEETWTLSSPHHTFQEKVKEVLEPPLQPPTKWGQTGTVPHSRFQMGFSDVDGAS